MKESRPYAIEFAPAAAREFRKLEQRVQRRVGPTIDSLAMDPRPNGAEKLTGEEFYRVRAGNFRIIYAIDDQRRLVLVARVKDRKDVYR